MGYEKLIGVKHSHVHRLSSRNGRNRFAAVTINAFQLRIWKRRTYEDYLPNFVGRNLHLQLVAATGSPRRRSVARRQEMEEPVIERVRISSRRSTTPEDAVYLPRSVIMDKEVITRTSGKRLGYVNQVYVDPGRLQVVSLYMRANASSFGANNVDHVLISSLRQIGDVILVHDESSLLDPPADEMYGYISLIGSVVETEDGTKLGKIRDFVFNPDSGEIVAIQYDALGIPSIPQSLLSCFSLDWREILAVGPNEAIVRQGAQNRARKENDGWVSEYVSALVNVVTGAEDEKYMLGSDAYRSDPAYVEWYERHAKDYESYYKQKLPTPIRMQEGRLAETRTRNLRRSQARQKPAALPPPKSRTFNQALVNNESRRQGEEAMMTRSMSTDAILTKDRKSESGRSRNSPQRIDREDTTRERVRDRYQSEEYPNLDSRVGRLKRSDRYVNKSDQRTTDPPSRRDTELSPPRYQDQCEEKMRPISTPQGDNQ